MRGLGCISIGVIYAIVHVQTAAETPPFSINYLKAHLSQNLSGRFTFVKAHYKSKLLFNWTFFIKMVWFLLGKKKIYLLHSWVYKLLLWLIRPADWGFAKISKNIYFQQKTDVTQHPQISKSLLRKSMASGPSWRPVFCSFTCLVLIQSVLFYLYFPRIEFNRYVCGNNSDNTGIAFRGLALETEGNCWPDQFFIMPRCRARINGDWFPNRSEAASAEGTNL